MYIYFLFFNYNYELLTYFWDGRWNGDGRATCREKYREEIDVEEHGCCHGEARSRNNFAWRRKWWNVASISNFADTSVSIAFAIPFTDHAIQRSNICLSYRFLLHLRADWIPLQIKPRGSDKITDHYFLMNCFLYCD